MAGIAYRLRLRLFLEGVEVPVIAAVVQAAPNSPAVASIQIPPLPAGTYLHPRTLVHLYFYDLYEGKSDRSGVRSAGPPPEDTSRFDALGLVGGEKLTRLARQQEAKSRAVDQAVVGDTGDTIGGSGSKYKLLFGGEIVGFQWTKGTSSRSLVLQCLDWSNYWDYAYQWNNTDLFGPGVKALFSGGATNLFTDLLDDQGMAILKIIQTPSVQFPELKGLLGGLIHLLEAIGGSYYTGKKFAGQNVFFSLAELRLHVTQMITAYEKDPTARRLISAEGYDGLFGRTLGGLGEQVSIRQALNALMGMIFHETYPIPAPLFVPGTGNGPSGRNQRLARNDPNYSYIATTADELLDIITSIRSGIAENSQVYRSATPREVLIRRLSAMRDSCKSVLNKLKDKEVVAAKGFYGTALRHLDTAVLNAKRWLPAVKNDVPLQQLDSALVNASLQLKKASEFYIVSSTKGVRAARLNQQIFRPDVWFSAPPRCNVLFPECYHTLSYARSFLQEPTRLLLKTNDEFFGEDILFDRFYFAPKGITLKAGNRSLQAVLSNDLLEHEVFTGILPVFEKMGELNIFAARAGAINGKQPKVGLAQRSTNFLYFKYRFGARHLSVSGRFNPYVVPGFPGLIIDKYVDRAAVENRQRLIEQAGGTSLDIDKLLGTHFLANFTEVTHSLDQSGGRTDINCGYARQPEEGVEFLGIERDQKVRRRYGNDAVRISVVASVDPPKVGSLGPNLGNIVKVEEVTAAYFVSSVEGKKLRLYNNPRRDLLPQNRLEVVVGLALPASDHGPGIVSLFGDPDVIVTFRAWRVSEEVPRYRKETVDLPAEEYIRPGWYGDCWHPSVIGKVYTDFFKTGAITDEQEVTTEGGGSIGIPFEEAETILASASKVLEAGDLDWTRPGLLALDRLSSVQAAVAFLVQTYSTIRQGKFDIEEFIRAYTWRPVATMNEMFGSDDLEFSEDGRTVVQGVEGFHSRAFGPYEDLFGLVTPDIENVTGIKKGSTAAQKGDTRKRKREAVEAYVSALATKAVLG